MIRKQTISTIKNSKDIVCYQGKSYQSLRLIWELYANANRILKSVYLFQNFDEYCEQLKSDKQDDKLKIFWNTLGNEKLIDNIKISVAFENYNKAFLLSKGIMVHKINPKFNKNLSSKQKKGHPIKFSTIFKDNFSTIELIDEKSNYYLAIDSNYTTISYSHTLNSSYQNIIGLDNQLVFELKKINQKRNRLHFYTDRPDAFLVEQHIKRWTYILEKSNETIERGYETANNNLKKFIE